MLKLGVESVEGFAVTIFEPFEDFEGVKVDFRIVLIEAEEIRKEVIEVINRYRTSSRFVISEKIIGIYFEEITEVMKEVINRYQVSPFTSCFVINEDIIGFYYVVGFIRAIMDYRDTKKLTVKHLEWTAAAKVSHKVPGSDLRQALQRAFNKITTVECTWRWDWKQYDRINSLERTYQAVKRRFWNNARVRSIVGCIDILESGGEFKEAMKLKRKLIEQIQQERRKVLPLGARKGGVI